MSRNKILPILPKRTVILIATFVLLIVSGNPLMAQQSLNVKEKWSFDSSDSITKCIEHTDTGETICFFSNFICIDTIREGGYKGYPTHKFENGILFENGKRIILGVNERIVSSSQNKILTNQITWKDYTATFRLYELVNNDLKLINQISKSGEYNGRILRSGNIVFDDYYELACMNIEIFSEKFDLLEVFQPFSKRGFENLKYIDNENEVLFLAGDYANESKVLIVDSKSGHLKYEKEFYIPCSVLKSFGNYFISYGMQKLTAVDNTGMLLWQKEILLPQKKFAGNSVQHSLYITEKANIQKLDIRNGVKLWVRNFGELLNDEEYIYSPYPSNGRIKVLCFEAFPDKDILAVVLGYLKRGSSKSNTVKHSYKLFLLNGSGEIIIEQDGFNETYLLQMIITEKGLKIINDREETYYELDE